MSREVKCDAAVASIDSWDCVSWHELLLYY